MVVRSKTMAYERLPSSDKWRLPSWRSLGDAPNLGRQPQQVVQQLYERTHRRREAQLLGRAPAAMDPPPAPSAEGSSVRPAEGTAAPHHADSGPQQPPLQNGTAHEPDLRELPVVLQDLVPLSYLIDRVVAAAYSDLATLVETLPGSLHGPDASHDHLQQQQRKRSIVDHVLATRRQLVKLLVLARWGAEAHRVHTAVNLVGFLAIQNVQVDRAIEHLRESHDLLARARVRTYDLDTAVKVLSLDAAADASQDLRIDPHAYSSLPAALTDHFAPDAAAPLSDDQALTTLSELNRVLLARLVLRLEPLPAPLADPTHWNVHDGRVTFRVDGMWEADLTYGGGNSAEDEAEEGREWYLLAVRFLFRVKDNRGGELFAVICSHFARSRTQPCSLVVDPARRDQGPPPGPVQPRAPSSPFLSRPSTSSP